MTFTISTLMNSACGKHSCVCLLNSLRAVEARIPPCVSVCASAVKHNVLYEERTGPVTPVSTVQTEGEKHFKKLTSEQLL